MRPSPLTRLRGWLAAEGTGSAYLSDPVSIAYLTGFRSDPGERTMALIVAADRALLLVPVLEAEAARDSASGVEVTAWQDGDDPHEKVRPLLEGQDRLAVEKTHLSLGRADELQSRFGVGELIDAGPALSGFRLLKDAVELEALARAAAATDSVVEQALAGLCLGQSELEVAAQVAALIAGTGARPSFETIVQSGANSALPHLRPTERRLTEGDLVLLDLGAALGGYHGDITRMAVVGQADARQLQVHQAVLDAHDAALAAVRPGATAGEVDEAGRRVLRRAGLGEYFIHRIGHGLGLQCHEAPSLDPGSSLLLQEGMVLTIEPGAYIPGWGGIRIEDDVVVAAHGARPLTEADHSLRVAPAG